jgi:integrase
LIQINYSDFLSTDINIKLFILIHSSLASLSDLLKREKILKMIEVAEGDQDKTIIAVLAESECRIGELQKYRVKDIERIADFVRVNS